MQNLQFVPSRRLDGLQIAHQSANSGASALSGLSLVVVGAGPAGLTFARAAALEGAHVIVLEQAGDPSGTDAGYTNRSFNITLDEVGRNVLSDERAWQGGNWIRGRALHSRGADAPVTGLYGDSQDAYLMSIPRPVLRQNLGRLAHEAGADLRFDSPVTHVDAESGVVTYTDPKGQEQTVTADLVIVSDGFHSLAHTLTGHTVNFDIRPEPRNYVVGLLSPEQSHGLALDYIHFWHEANNDSYTVGIPNHDGSVALLLASQFGDIAEDAEPFATLAEAEARLKRDFPQLHALSPELSAQLTTRRRGCFQYKTASCFLLGSRAVLMGDAGCVVPPWAGFGANTAMYAASFMVHQLMEQNRDVVAATANYEAQMMSLSRLLLSYVDAQGEFLSGPVTEDPSARSDSLEPIIRRALQAALLQPAIR
ncbi:MAG TPA: FAD-dependent monooxygenase [Candidatus Saccharimonadia bacterium]|jgi:2-polyprenyl-6-methoxyphenol hydroxylase-like FAD-dependent oxidoreductase|nr:FAD-dependent monooxygenase [Candidatus Saccharimonadia bacterium]